MQDKRKISLRLFINHPLNQNNQSLVSHPNATGSMVRIFFITVLCALLFISFGVAATVLEIGESVEPSPESVPAYRRKTRGSMYKKNKKLASGDKKKFRRNNKSGERKRGLKKLANKESGSKRAGRKNRDDRKLGNKNKKKIGEKKIGKE